jgi:hypothetical protein
MILHLDLILTFFRIFAFLSKITEIIDNTSGGIIILSVLWCGFLTDLAKIFKKNIKFLKNSVNFC